MDRCSQSGSAGRDSANHDPIERRGPANPYNQPVETLPKSVSFADLTIGQFVERLSSAEPVPGGGSASALAAALGAALVSMVAGLSVGRSKYSAYKATLARADVAGKQLAAEFLALSDRDADAYAGYAVALKLPRHSDAQSEARLEAIRAAARVASDAPWDCVRACLRLAEVAESLAGRSNVNASSDVLVAALLAEAGARGSGAAPPGRQPDRGRDPRRPDRRLRRVQGALGLRAHARVVLVGADAPSAVYLQQILRTCEKVGVDGRLVEIGSDVTRTHSATRSSASTPIRPWPGSSSRCRCRPTSRCAPVIDSIDPAKDIDGIHPRNAGLLSLGYDGFLPATAQASVEILKRSGIEIAGKRVVVVGRSNVVGKPAALLLMREHGTVSILHSKTRDLGHHTRDAEILVVAAGGRASSPARCSRRGSWSWTSASTSCRTGRAARSSSATWTSNRRRASSRRSRRCPAASGPLTNALLLTHLLRAATDQAERSAAAAD
jgi:methylenetetrahydrofolate dehydrogenase (NADP+)/methenyltetrahydrofolate cyclohydrolase